MAQYLWGKALVETGQEHRDPWMIRESWAHLKMARDKAGGRLAEVRRRIR
jgi:hypothetical protein